MSKPIVVKKPATVFTEAPIFANVKPPAAVAYQVVVEPRKPKTETAGGIVLAKRSRQADQALQSIGKILALGPLTWTGPTFTLSETARPQVGDWVVFRQHAGQQLRIGKKGGNEYSFDDQLEEFYRVMLDTDVLARFDSEEHAAKFYGWLP